LENTGDLERRSTEGTSVDVLWIVGVRILSEVADGFRGRNAASLSGELGRTGEPTKVADCENRPSEGIFLGDVQTEDFRVSHDAIDDGREGIRVAVFSVATTWLGLWLRNSALPETFRYCFSSLSRSLSATSRSLLNFSLSGTDGNSRLRNLQVRCSILLPSLNIGCWGRPRIERSQVSSWSILTENFWTANVSGESPETRFSITDRRQDEGAFLQRHDVSTTRSPCCTKRVVSMKKSKSNCHMTYVRETEKYIFPLI